MAISSVATGLSEEVILREILCYHIDADTSNAFLPTSRVEHPRHRGNEVAPGAVLQLWELVGLSEVKKLNPFLSSGKRGASF